MSGCISVCLQDTARVLALACRSQCSDMQTMGQSLAPAWVHTTLLLSPVTTCMHAGGREQRPQRAGRVTAPAAAGAGSSCTPAAAAGGGAGASNAGRVRLGCATVARATASCLWCEGLQAQIATEPTCQHKTTLCFRVATSPTPCKSLTHPHVSLRTILQAEEASAARISDLQSTLEVCQADADSLREQLSQAELQRREAERHAAIANAAGGQQHRCASTGRCMCLWCGCLYLWLDSCGPAC